MLPCFIPVESGQNVPGLWASSPVANDAEIQGKDSSECEGPERNGRPVSRPRGLSCSAGTRRDEVGLFISGFFFPKVPFVGVSSGSGSVPGGRWWRCGGMFDTSWLLTNTDLKRNRAAKTAGIKL